MSRYSGFLRVASVALSASLLFADSAAAQTRMYGGTQNGDTFYSIAIDTGATLSTLGVTVPGHTILVTHAVTVDPTTGKMYAIVTGVTGRLLITIDPATAVGVEVGSLGDAFSSLAFRADGQLFGTTDDDATVPETMYLIDKTNAAKIVATTLGNGDDGEIIAYAPANTSFYHWSGVIDPVFERIQGVAPYAVTAISITGATSEVLGAVWDCRNNRFVVSNAFSRLQTYALDGTVGPEYGATLQGPVRACVHGSNLCRRLPVGHLPGRP